MVLFIIWYNFNEGDNMSIIYMLSGPMKNKGFEPNIEESIKKDLNGKKSIVFIPTSPTNYEKNDLYTYGNSEIKGIMTYIGNISNIDKVTIIDDRISSYERIELIKNTDVIYLLGGNPFNQIEYINNNKYDELIRNFNGIIIGTSAGAMNLCKNVYYSKDEDFDKSIFYDGIGLVDITIDPHFDINNKEQVEEIINNSVDKEIIGLPNESAIRIENGNIEYINEIYIYNGKEKSRIIKR